MGFRDFFGKIRQGLARTRGVFTGVADLFRLRGKVDRNFLDELEKRLYLADVGNAATATVTTSSLSFTSATVLRSGPRTLCGPPLQK